MEWLAADRWSPYVVGAGIGVLSWIAFLLSDRPIGCSSAFSHTAGMILKLFHGEKIERLPYFKKTRPEVDWQWMLVVGIVIGSFISAKLSGQFHPSWVPERWALRHSDAAMPRLIVALIGGTIMGFGARWAGGCTSGHGISGVFQLAVSSWIAAICFFITAAITTMLIL